MVTEQLNNRGLLIEEEVSGLHQRLKQLNQLRKSRHFCDVVLQVGSMEFHGHRAVLASASPYFFELFTVEDEQTSAREDKQILYKLGSGFDKDSLSSIVNYAYTGHLDVTAGQVKSLYSAAIMLKMDAIIQACGIHFIEHLTPENCLELRTIPGIASCANLASSIDQYIQNQKDLIRVTKEVMDVSRIQLKVLHASKDEAAITSRALCNLSLEWVRRQLEDEDIMLHTLKEKKHLLYLNIDNSLHDCSEIQSGSSNDTEIIQDYRKISRKHSQPNMKVRRKLSSSTQPAKPRMLLYHRSVSGNSEELQDADWKLIAHSEVGEDSHLAIVTLKGSVSILSIKQLICPPSPTATSPKTSRSTSVEKSVDLYTVIPHMSSPKCACGIGSFNGKLLVCGGYDRGECLKGVEEYCAETNTWTLLPEMRKGRGRFDLTVLNGKAYAVGGCDGTKELSSVEVLDKNTKKWTSVSHLPLARSNTGVCNLNDRIYCVGGWNGLSGIKQCDVYEPETDAWKTVASLHVGRYQASVVSFMDLVYAIGGCDSWNCLNSTEVYNPALDTWRCIASMTTSRRGCGAAVFNGKIYVMGGSDGTQSLCTTEIYNPETNCWSVGPPMMSCRANVGGAVVAGRLYAVGGFSGKGFLNSIEYLDSATNEWTNFTPKPGCDLSKDQDKELLLTVNNDVIRTIDIIKQNDISRTNVNNKNDKILLNDKNIVYENGVEKNCNLTNGISEVLENGVEKNCNITNGASEVLENGVEKNCNITNGASEVCENGLSKHVMGNKSTESIVKEFDCLNMGSKHTNCH